MMPLIGWLIYFQIKLIVGGMYGFCGGGIYEYLKSRRFVSAADEQQKPSKPDSAHDQRTERRLSTDKESPKDRAA
jgi:hypothetical protein